MKNELIRKKAKSNRDKLDTQSKEYFECDCVHCDNLHQELMENAGRTRKQLPNGEWGEEIPCNMYKITCILDMRIKGYIFSPYEDFKPDFCPMHINAKKSKISLSSLLRKIFQSFF